MEADRYIDPYNNKGKYEFRRLRPLAKPEPPKPFEWDKAPEGSLNNITGYDSGANPLDNMQIMNNSDARAMWQVPPGSNVRDIPDYAQDPLKKPTSQLPDPDKPDRKKKIENPDKPKKVEDPEKPKPVEDSDKPKPKEDTSDPSSGDKGGTTDSSTDSK